MYIRTQRALAVGVSDKTIQSKRLGNDSRFIQGEIKMKLFFDTEFTGLCKDTTLISSGNCKHNSLYDAVIIQSIYNNLSK